MTKPLFLLAAGFLSISYTGAYAQNSKFNFKLGQEYDLPRKTEDLAFFGNEKDGLVNLSIKKEELIVVRFNPKTLNKSLEQKIDLDVTRNFNSEILADFSNNNYFWLHSDWDKSSETEMLFYDKINVQTGKIAEANRKMFETSKIAGSKMPRGFYGAKTTDKYEFDFDVERKILCVSYRLTPETRNDKKNFDKIGFQVFDNNMKKIWGNEFTMPYTEAVMDNSDFSVDSKGNGYLLAKVYESEKRKEMDKSTGKPGYHYEVLKFTKDSKKIISIPVTVDENYIRETTITENSLNEMIIACTYSKKSKGAGTDGIFLSTIDKDNKLVKYKNGYYEFPKEELAKFESARSRRKIEKNDDYEAKNLKVRDVIVEKDGGILITCEEYQVIQHYSTSSSGYTRITYTYYYEDIFAARVNASGAFEWMRKIPKRQRGSAGRGTMGFKLINDETGYYFLYLDNLKNLKLPEDEVPRYHLDGFGGQVIVSKITKDGKVSKDLLFDTREEDIMIFPSQFYKIDGDRFIGRARLKKNLFQPLLITTN
ncbi:hypothetical protein [Flavitalea sp.]|nr:hypothetical protein [Flavitalea sp.]